jgi:FimV-like protein
MPCSDELHPPTDAQKHSMIRFHRTLVATAAALALLGISPLAPAQAPAPSATAADPGTLLTKEQDNLWNLAARYERGARITRQQWMAAVLRRNPDAFVLGNMHRLRAGVTLDLPTEAEAQAESLAASERLIERHLGALAANTPMAVLPLPADARPRQGSTVAAAPSLPASAPVTAPAVPAAPAVQASAPSAAASAAVTPPLAEPVARPAPGAAAPGVVPAESETWRRWLPHGLAIGLAVLVVGLLWHVRRGKGDFAETISTLFKDTIKLVGKSRPKVIAVSQAGADVARSVERLGGTAHLVRSSEAQAGVLPGSAEHEAGIKLEVARTQIEIGRTEAALAMLRRVAREGSIEHRLAAEKLLTQLGAA